MAACFPMFVNLEGKKVLVIGQGKVASHKEELLREYGAQVIRRLSLSCGEIEPLLDKEDPFLVVISLKDSAVEREVSLVCRKRRIPVNVVDVPPLCTFVFPSIARDEEVVVAVSSSGNSPLVSQMVRDLAKDALLPEIGAVNALMGDIRKDIIRDFPDQAQRKEAFRLILSEMLRIRDMLQTREAEKEERVSKQH